MGSVNRHIGIELLFVALVLSGCSIFQAVRLKDCTYQYTRISDVTFLEMNKQERRSIIGMVKIIKALTGFTETAPLAFTIHLKVTNPNRSIASLDRLYYAVSLDSIRVAEGYSTEPFAIPSEATADLPLHLSVDIKQLLNSDARPTVIKMLREFLGFDAEPTDILILLRPVVRVAGTPMGIPNAIPVHFTYGERDEEADLPSDI